MTEASLYTFLANIDGGTYISQVYSDSIEAAANTWAENIDEEVLLAFHDSNNNNLRDEMKARINEGDNLTIIKTVSNVWFIYLSVNDVSAYINIVKTIS